MSAHTIPAQIEPFKWAEQGYTWSGQLPLSRFVRIAQETVGSVEQQQVQVSCSLTLDEYHHFVWLDAQLSATISLECQRCLKPVDIEVDTTVHVAILNDEAQLDYVDEDADFIILGEDLGTQAATFKTAATVDLIYILEDELLLSLPTSPKHTQCESRYLSAATAAEEQKRDNPFEALAALKGKLN